MALLAASSAMPLTLTVLAFGGYLPPDIEATFEKRASSALGEPVDLKVRLVLDENDTFDLVRAGKVDVFISTSESQLDERLDYASRRLTLKVDTTRLTNWRAVDPKTLEFPAVRLPDGVHAVPVLSGPMGLLVDSKRLDPARATWNALLAPENAGKYIITNSPQHLAYIAAIACGLEKDDIFPYDALIKNPKCRETHAALVQNALRAWEGNDRPADFDGAKLGMSWAAALKALRKSDASWQFVVPEGPQLVCLDFWMLARNAKWTPRKRDLAHLFMDYTLSNEFQRELVVKRGSWEPVNVNVRKTTPASAYAGNENLRTFDWNDPDRLVLKPLRTRDRLGYLELLKKSKPKTSAKSVPGTAPTGSVNVRP